MTNTQLLRAEVGPLPHHPMIPPLPEKEPQKERQSAPPPATLIYLPEKRVWQHKMIIYNLPQDTLPTEATLDELGSEGWELTAILPLDNSFHFYFKRLR